MTHPTQEFLRRHCPQWAAQIQFESIDAPGWEAAAAGGGIVVRGNSLLAQAVGLRRFLEEYAGMSLAYAGTEERVTFTLRVKKLPLPFAPMQGGLPAQARACFGPLTFAGSPCWWDWERWQDEIDILALYGVNEALLLIGSEYAWFQALRAEGIGVDYAMGGMSAPPFWPRQLQGKFDSVLPPVDPMYLKSRGQMGKAIAERMRAWGITPVPPAFPGTVGNGMYGILRNGARLIPQPSWNGYKFVFKIDPACAAYTRLKNAYETQLAQIFGEIERTWDPQETLEGQALPPEGRTVLHGDAAAAAGLVQSRACRADEPESNPLLHTLYMEALARDKPAGLEAWLRGYARRRYGTDQAEGVAALRLLCGAVYAQGGPAPGSVFCMRPATALEPTGPGDAVEAGYSSLSLFQCANLLLRVKSDMPGWRFDLCDILRQALSAKARESYLRAMDGFRQKDSRAFERGANDFLGLLEDCDRLLRCEEAFRLDYHLARARACAKMDAERNNFELVLLLQHSVYGAGGVHKKFGYQLHGQAWREWAGLLGSLHAKRWRGFFSHLAAHFGERRFSLATKDRPLGRTAYAGNKFYEQMAQAELEWMRNFAPSGEEGEDVRDAAQELCRKYANDEN
ncbi:MAG: alpha-N-acetylglucosaminidase [Oscillospiraceae bacterium]|jgi:hypothetical protein|nr:alpha-N-acetylglucosaminidase [Oscillospiraceae bacterium]